MKFSPKIWGTFHLNVWLKRVSTVLNKYVTCTYTCTQGRSVTKIWGRDEGKNINGWLQNAKQHGAITNGPLIKFALKI